MCKLIIHAEGEIDSKKIGDETAKEIKKEIRKFSPDAVVNVSFQVKDLGDKE